MWQFPLNVKWTDFSIFISFHLTLLPPVLPSCWVGSSVHPSPIVRFTFQNPSFKLLGGHTMKGHCTYFRVCGHEGALYLSPHVCPLISPISLTLLPFSITLQKVWLLTLWDQHVSKQAHEHQAHLSRSPQISSLSIWMLWGFVHAGVSIVSIYKKNYWHNLSCLVPTYCH